MLERAISLAAQAHAGQIDKAGEPYILHPIRVMLKMDSEAARTVAILHDVVEDTDVDLDALLVSGFPKTVVDAVDCLTKRDGEPYEQSIERAASNPLARKVKMGDLEDNMNWRRLKGVTQRDQQRMERYASAYQKLASRV